VSLPRSLRARVVAAAVAALAAGLALAGVALLSAVERDGRQAVDAELAGRAEQVRGGIGRFRGGGGLRGGRGRRGLAGPGLLAGSGTFVRVLSGGEEVEVRGDVPEQVPPPPAGEGYETVELDGAPWRALAIPAGRAGRGLRLQLFQSLEPVERQVARTRRLILLGGGLALALTALAAWGAASVVLRPLARLRTAAAGVTGTPALRSRLPEAPSDPDEVAALAAALNGMLGRLEASAEATRRFAADAGHELRTPMTGLGANLDALARNPDLDPAERRRALAEMQAEHHRMVGLLEGLQALARGEAAEAVPREPVELGDLLDAAVQGARRRHPETAFALREAPEAAVIEGWPDGLRMLVDNLLENAAVHGRPGGAVAADVRPLDDGGGYELRVDDDGPGLAPEERARVLAPFARAAGTTAPGTGLGLAVAAQQAALHGGELELGDAPGGGLRASARLASRPGGGPPRG